MSDRLAVFNAGRIEQVGSTADVYERPSTPFVAGFVGTSNLLSGDAAQQIAGAAGTFTVRPEKIRIAAPDEETADDELSASGRVRDAIYLGADTRYIVALESGGELVVTQQNRDASSVEAQEARGRPVRLIWRRRHMLPLVGE